MESLQLNTLRIGFSQPFNAFLCSSRWMGKLPSHCFIQLQVKMKTSNFNAVCTSVWVKMQYAKWLTDSLTRGPPLSCRAFITSLPLINCFMSHTFSRPAFHENVLIKKEIWGVANYRSMTRIQYNTSPVKHSFLCNMINYHFIFFSLLSLFFLFHL